MKKKVILAIVTATLLTTTLLPSISVSANPESSSEIQFDKDTQNKYSEMENRYYELEKKVQELDDQISLLICKINNNNNEIDNVNTEIDNTKKEIEQKKEDIEEEEEILGKRLRELYKSGGQNSYISLVFSADNLGDFISKIDDTAKLMNLDRKVVKELGDSKNKLDESVDNLEKKSDEIKDLNNEIEEEKVNLDVKKKEQEQATSEAKVEKDKFESENLVPMETAKVTPWINEATNSNSSLDKIKYDVSILNASQAGLKSESVKAQVSEAINKANELIRKKTEEQEKARQQRNEQQSGNGQHQATTPALNTNVSQSSNAADLISYAMRFIGVPYVWGGTTPDGFDCSGFTQYVFSHAAGIGLGRTTYEQINNGREVSRENLQPGDLIFPSAHHVAIYIGNGQMIHAPHTGDKVKIANVYGFWRARRIL